MAFKHVAISGPTGPKQKEDEVVVVIFLELCSRAGILGGD